MKNKTWILIILLLALTVRIYPLQNYTEWDESIYLQHAEYIDEGKNNYNEWQLRPPLVSILIAEAWQVWDHIYAAQILINILAALIVIPIYYIGKKLHSKKAGQFSSLLVAIYPLFVRNGHMILTDSILATFLATTLLLTLKQEKTRSLIAGLIGGLAILTKFTALAPLAILGLYHYWKERKKLPKKTLLYTIGTLIPVIPYLAWNQKMFGNMLQPFIQSARVASTAGSQQWIYPVLTIPLMLGLALYTWQSKKDREYLTIATLWTVTVTLGVITIHIEPRYLIPAVLPFIPLAGIGYTDTTEKLKWKHATTTAIALITIFSLPAFTYFQYNPTVNWKTPTIKATEYINQNNITEKICATKDYPVYAYYTQNKINVVDGPHFEEYYPQILRGSCILTVYKNRDQIPTISWADQQPRLQEIYENEKLKLYRYH